MSNNFVSLPKLILDTTNINLGVPDWRIKVEQIFDEMLLHSDEILTTIRQVVRWRSGLIDDLLCQLFCDYQLNKTNLALFATGGYGRGELHLHSDVDILLLSKDEINFELKQKIEVWLAKLWDIGIEPALAVRSLTECQQVCQADVTVATSLLEARLIIGNTELQNLPLQIVSQTWSHIDFYHAKMAEAKARYLRHNATEYNLEPDIKNAPGGLRDIHTVSWLIKRYFWINNLYDSAQQNFITEHEYDELQKAENFLWLVRHHLHHLTGRNENRLLFDYQRNIAYRMGYDDLQTDLRNVGVERFMRDYYQFAMSNANLSGMLTQHYYEILIENQLPKYEKPIEKPMQNPYFKWVGNCIAVVHSKIFAQYPEAILQMFLLMGQYNIKQVRTHTLRVLKVAAQGIDQAYRDNPLHKQLFLENLKQENLLYHRLRMMKRYGVLGRYLPAFAQVMGLMQYDLFHRYTVDEHTLLLLRILHRFGDNDPQKGYVHKFPLVSQLYRRIERKEILVLAAIFHDIAKGRGGDHSELGEQDALTFCLAHGLSQADAALVAWLVRHHLLMSLTAQKKDITDPDVLHQFAKQVGDVTHLNHLFVLTVADMNATNPQLWNSWRATLLKQLYNQTRRILQADMDIPINRQDMILYHKQQAKDSLSNEPNLPQIEQLWQELGDEYFLKEVPNDIVWHSKAIVAYQNSPNFTLAEPLIVLREHRDLALDALQVFIYTKNQANLFAITVAVFDKMDLDVLDARIITATKDFALDSYVLLDRHGTLLNDKYRQIKLLDQLKKSVMTSTLPRLVNKRMPRQLKCFDVPTNISFELNPPSCQHIMRLETLDQPALLARVGLVLLQHDIEVHYARITTLGERAEDMFYISDRQNQSLTPKRLENLKIAILQILKIDQIHDNGIKN